MAPAWGKVPAFLLPKEKQSQHTLAQRAGPALAQAKPLPAACAAAAAGQQGRVTWPASASAAEHAGMVDAVRVQHQYNGGISTLLVPDKPGSGSGRAARRLGAAAAAASFDVRAAEAVAAEHQVLLPMHGLAVASRTRSLAAAAAAGAGAANGDVPALGKLSDQRQHNDMAATELPIHLVSMQMHHVIKCGLLQHKLSGRATYVHVLTMHTRHCHIICAPITDCFRLFTHIAWNSAAHVDRGHELGQKHKEAWTNLHADAAGGEALQAPFFKGNQAIAACTHPCGAQ